MLIARQKKEENIAEYMLYMYQIEDVIRAYNFDVDRIINDFVRPQLPDASFLDQYRQWYEQLVYEMQSEKITETGHLLQLREILVELSYLHNSLINIVNDEKYKTLYEAANEHIEDFREHSNLKDRNQIEICFQALYMKLLLRLQKKEISDETEISFDSMRVLLAYLSRAYHQMKNGDGQYWNN
jgi:hypothetical protein